MGVDDGESAKKGIRWRSEKSDLFTPSLTISHQMAWLGFVASEWSFSRIVRIYQGGAFPFIYVGFIVVAEGVKENVKI